MRRFYNISDYEPQVFEESDVYQIPFLINRDTILSSFHAAVGGFVSYKNGPEMSREISDLCCQLEVMTQRKPDEARVICKELIEKLLHVETDDDTFPIFELQRLYKMVGEEKSYDEVAELYLASMD